MDLDIRFTKFDRCFRIVRQSDELSEVRGDVCKAYNEEYEISYDVKSHSHPEVDIKVFFIRGSIKSVELDWFETHGREQEIITAVNAINAKESFESESF
jgi:hypothetical protein